MAIIIYYRYFFQNSDEIIKQNAEYVCTLIAAEQRQDIKLNALQAMVTEASKNESLLLALKDLANKSHYRISGSAQGILDGVEDFKSAAGFFKKQRM